MLVECRIFLKLLHHKNARTLDPESDLNFSLASFSLVAVWKLWCDRNYFNIKTFPVSREKDPTDSSMSYT